MEERNNYIRFFKDLKNKDTAEVGGKNASLGEMISQLGPKGIRIPSGFATTSEAYRYFLDHNGLRQKVADTLEQLDKKDFKNLNAIGEKLRSFILDGTFPEDLEKSIKEAYHKLEEHEESLTSVAVRSSATAEDLPDASFAGQHDSFLNIQGAKNTLEACKKCYASLFTDRAIRYREHNGFDHLKVALSAGVQKMVRADKAAAGVGFTILPDTGYEKGHACHHFQKVGQQRKNDGLC